MSAVKNDRVYLYSYTLLQGIRAPVGLLFFAKCLHPELFADIDVGDVLKDLYQEFFNYDLPGVYVYSS
jgi:iron complex transport system substrate-binding protein